MMSQVSNRKAKRVRIVTMVMVRVAPSLVPCVLSPCMRPSPLRTPHPVLLHPQYACKGGGHAGGVGCVNWGGGPGGVRGGGAGGGAAGRGGGINQGMGSA